MDERVNFSDKDIPTSGWNQGLVPLPWVFGTERNTLRNGDVFHCRQCASLSYESQRENVFWRSISRAQRVRLRLGGSASLLDPFPSKPVGMHWDTYFGIAERARQQERRMLTLGLAHTHKMHDAIQRRAKAKAV